jgi:hypothetical protein
MRPATGKHGIFMHALTLSTWDIALVAAVSVQATALAYLPSPRWKALLLSLPVPFTLASLSVGRRVDGTNILALVLLLGYTYGVYYLRARWRLPIVAAIVLCAAGFCATACTLAPWVPRPEPAFWALVGLVFGLGVLLWRVMPYREEPTHRSPLPVYVKLPLVAGVILVLVVLKQYLQGFMTVFPMVGVVASYEGRHCLWTLTRQIPVLMLTMLPMMALVHVLYPYAGLGWALAGGWVLFAALLTPFTLRQWARETSGVH